MTAFTSGRADFQHLCVSDGGTYSESAGGASSMCSKSGTLGVCDHTATAESNVPKGKEGRGENCTRVQYSRVPEAGATRSGDPLRLVS